MKLDPNVIRMIRECESSSYTRDKLFWLLVEHYPEVVMVGFLNAFRKYESPYLPGVEISPETYDKVMDHVRANKIVEGIKELRAITRCGLKDAKDTVELWRDNECARLVAEKA